LKKLIIVALILLGAYLYFIWKPSALDIASEMKIGEAIEYQGEKYRSDWGTNSEEIVGYLRRKDRHYDENMPIVTYDIIITTGEFSNPEIVKITNKGGGSYYWRSKRRQPDGTLIVYHTVPATPIVQNKLDEIDEGESVTLVGKISENSEIKSDSDYFVRLGHDNHKFILVEDVIKM